MKRPLRKALAFVLALALSFQLVSFKAPISKAFASELSDFDIEEYDYGCILWGYNGKDTDVVIPSDAGIVYISIWADDKMKSLTVPEGVLEISIQSDTLEKLILPSTLSYLYVSSCTALKEIDLSKVSDSDSDPDAYLSYGIYDCPELETLKVGKLAGEIGIYGENKLTSLDFSSTNLNNIFIWDNNSIQEIKFSANCENVNLGNLSALKSADIPKNAYIYLYDLNFDAITIENNKYGFWVKDGCLYQNSLDEENDETTVSLVAIDFNRKVIDVADGTTYIGNLNLSGNYYKTEVINLPDSVVEFGPSAFDGGDQLKSFSFPKNVITLGAYCFSGFNPNVKLVIPESVRSINYDAFVGFKGKVSIEKETNALYEYEGGIYNYDVDEDGNRLPGNWLVYYPTNKTTAKLSPDVTYIGPSVFRDSAIKSLDIPNGVMWLDLYLNNAKNLTSITIPESVGTIYNPMLIYAPALKKVSVSPDNPYYASYKNCLYNKEMTALIDVPGALEKIEIPEGVISLNYYTVTNHDVGSYGSEEYKYVRPTVTFPKSIEEFDYYTLSFKSAKVYADTPVAEFIVVANNEFELYGEYYGYEPELYEYTLRDTNKELLNMIYVVDSIGIKKGKKTTISAEMPIGLNAVSKLTLGNNTECQVSFSSSNKKVAKVDSKTGEVKGVKKGTCTINVKCTIDNGKKKNTKTFKVKVKVK